MAQKSAISEYLRRASRLSTAAREFWAVGRGAGEGARALIVATAFGAGAAVTFALSAVSAQTGEAGAQSDAPAPVVQTGGIEAAPMAAASWADLSFEQQIAVIAAFVVILAVAAGATWLARQRAEARWLAARERRRILAESMRRPPKLRCAAARISSGRRESTDLQSYLDEFAAAPKGQKQLETRSTPPKTPSPYVARPITCQAAHARRRKRMQRRSSAPVSGASIQDRRSEMSSRLSKFAHMQTSMRKRGEQGAPMH